MLNDFGASYKKNPSTSTQNTPERQSSYKHIKYDGYAAGAQASEQYAIFEGRRSSAIVENVYMIFTELTRPLL